MRRAPAPDWPAVAGPAPAPVSAMAYLVPRDAWGYAPCMVLGPAPDGADLYVMPAADEADADADEWLAPRPWPACEVYPLHALAPTGEHWPTYPQ